mgnify:FL=1|tara:strand:+ start:1387 stop:1644 length:258 start_codon:yes stop_codon:yes gene_type:complete
MTNAGMFEDPEKIEYLKNQNTLLKQKLKEAVSKIKRIQTLEEHHLKNNGDLRVHITKIEKENKFLNDENKRLVEENSNLSIVRNK